MKRLFKMLVVFLPAVCLILPGCLLNPWNLINVPLPAPGGVSFIPNTPPGTDANNPANTVLDLVTPIVPTPIRDFLCGTVLDPTGPIGSRICP